MHVTGIAHLKQYLGFFMQDTMRSMCFTRRPHFLEAHSQRAGEYLAFLGSYRIDISEMCLPTCTHSFAHLLSFYPIALQFNPMLSCSLREENEGDRHGFLNPHSGPRVVWPRVEGLTDNSMIID